MTFLWSYIGYKFRLALMDGLKRKEKTICNFDFETEIIVNCVSNFLTLEQIQTFANFASLVTALCLDILYCGKPINV